MYISKPLYLIRGLTGGNPCKRSLHTSSLLKGVVQNTRLDMRSLTKNDTLLYESSNPRGFIKMNVLSIGTCCLWSYIGYFMAFEVKDSYITHKSKFWNWLLLKEKKYSYLLGMFSIVLGTVLPATVGMYTLRSVRTLVLNKGGKSITIVTHGIPQLRSTLKVPISEVSACSSRKRAKLNMAIKIKNKWFHYLIDTRGNIKNPSLFDFTVGVERNF